MKKWCLGFQVCMFESKLYLLGNSSRDLLIHFWYSSWRVTFSPWRKRHVFTQKGHQQKWQVAKNNNITVNSAARFLQNEYYMNNLYWSCFKEKLPKAQDFPSGTKMSLNPNICLEYVSCYYYICSDLPSKLLVPRSVIYLSCYTLISCDRCLDRLFVDLVGLKPFNPNRFRSRWFGRLLEDLGKEKKHGLN